jgi:cytidyltransferase-like protein
MQDIIINEISSAVKQGKKISFVSGNFNVVHPGHLRLLKFASEISDVLVVCVLKDGNPGIYVPLPLRIDGLRALSIVSHVIVAEPDYMAILRSVRPHYVIKGPEFKDVDNLESQFLNEYGGKLLFSSGEIAFSSIQLLGLELSGRLVL